MGSRIAKWPMPDRFGFVAGLASMWSFGRDIVLIAGASNVYRWGNDGSASVGRATPPAGR